MFEIELVGYLAVIPDELLPEFDYVERRYEYIPEERVKRYVPYTLSLTSELRGRTVVGLGALLYLVRERGLRVRIKNKPALPTLRVPQWMWEKLRDYQTDCLRDVLNQWAGLIQSPVGSGKTEMEVALALAGMEHSNVMFIAPGLPTLDNFIDRMKEYGVPDEVFIEYPRLRRLDDLAPTGRIIVAHASAVNNDLAAGYVPHAETVGMLLSDEAHHWSCESWNALLWALPALYRSFGFSATLVQDDYDTYGGSFADLSSELARAISPCGPLLHEVPIEKVKGHIEVPTVISVPYEWTNNKVVGKTDWRYLAPMVYAERSRIELVVRIARDLVETGRQILLPVSKKEYGIEIWERLGMDDCVCWYGNGHIKSSDPTLSFSNIKSRVADGRVNLLIVTQHLNEGANLPSLNTIFLTEGRKARGTIQRTGRTTRKGGDFGSLVVNLFDIGNDVLERQAAARESTIVEYYKSDPARRYPSWSDAMRDLEDGTSARATGLGLDLGASRRRKVKRKNSNLFF